MPPETFVDDGEAGPEEEYPSTPPLADQNSTEAGPCSPGSLEEHVCRSLVAQAAQNRQEDVPNISSLSPSVQESIKTEPSREERASPNVLQEAAKATMDKVKKRPRLPKRATAIYGEVSRLQEKFLMDHTELTNTRYTAGFSLKDLKESLSEFKEISKAVEPLQQPPDQDSTSALKNSYSRLLSSIENFEADVEQVAQLEQSLGRVEYKLVDLQPKLFKLIDDRFDTQQDFVRQTAKYVPSNDRAVSVSSETPLEHEYYDKRGDVRLLKEQLFNLRHEIQKLLDNEDHVSYAFLPMTEHSVAPEENQSSLEQRQIRYEEMKERLQQEEKELKRLWKECRKAGLEVGSLGEEISWPFDTHNQLPASPTRDTPRVELEEELLPPPNYFSHVLQSFRWPQLGIFPRPAMPELPVLGEKWDMIQEWLQKPSGIDAIFAQGGSLIANEVERRPSTPKSDSEWVALGKYSNGYFEPDEIVNISMETAATSNPQTFPSKQDPRLLRASKSDERLGQSFREQTPSPRRSAANVGLR